MITTSNSKSLKYLVNTSQRGPLVYGGIIMGTEYFKIRKDLWPEKIQSMYRI